VTETKEQVRAAVKAPAVPAPEVEIRFGERRIVAKLSPAGLGQTGVPVLLGDIINAANEIHTRECAGAQRHDDLPQVVEGRRWRIEQWKNVTDRASRRLAAIGCLVSDSHPPAPPAFVSKHEREVKVAAVAEPEPKPGSLADANRRLLALEQRQTPQVETVEKAQ